MLKSTIVKPDELFVPVINGGRDVSHQEAAHIIREMGDRITTREQAQMFLNLGGLYFDNGRLLKKGM